MTSLSTHVLDIAEGKPAAGVDVSLEVLVDGEWHPVGEATTDANGRVSELATGLVSGMYRVVFGTGDYGNTFFPGVHVVMTLDDAEDHYHVPLLLSPFGYTTYRGELSWQS